MLSILAFSVQHEVEKYGAYLAIASFLGLALLSILYFAQAREVRRLRDWAGRAPERDAELEARVTMQAEEARRGQAARPAQPASRRGACLGVAGHAGHRAAGRRARGQRSRGRAADRADGPAPRDG